MNSPIRLHWLDPQDPSQEFPDAEHAMLEPNGLLAIGGDLSSRRLLSAYRRGIFPWYNPDEPILWWCPDPRSVLRPDELHLSRSFRKAIRRQDYAVTMNHAFAQVIEHCSQPRKSQHGTWLGPGMRRAYTELHRAGFCHSIEIWRQGTLVGGLYGVSQGRAFFGESMFSLIDNGSKLAMYHLCCQLAEWKFDLIDCQINSEHLGSLGATEIPRRQFLTELAVSTRRTGPPAPWQLSIEVPCQAIHLPNA